jgi:hypothetical protein
MAGKKNNLIDKALGVWARKDRDIKLMTRKPLYLCFTNEHFKLL